MGGLFWFFCDATICLVDFLVDLPQWSVVCSGIVGFVARGGSSGRCHCFMHANKGVVWNWPAWGWAGRTILAGVSQEREPAGCGRLPCKDNCRQQWFWSLGGAGHSSI